MRVYCVRHAESKLNALNVHQSASVGLSESGVVQAQLLAQRLAALPIDRIVSSPYGRAVETAAYVGQAVCKPVEVTPLLTEVKNPSAIEGKHHDDPDAVRIKRHILENLHRPDWRHSDEETFFDTRDRARRCLQYVVDLAQDNVILITHGGFITMMVAMMLYGDDVEPGDYLRLRLFTQMRNTGITVCHYSAADRWTLVTWNDHAHLDGM